MYLIEFLDGDTVSVQDVDKDNIESIKNTLDVFFRLISLRVYPAASNGSRVWVYTFSGANGTAYRLIEKRCRSLTFNSK